MLDTDTASHLIRGGNSTLDRRLRHTSVDQLCLSVISAAELLFGAKSLPRSQTRHAEVSTFLDLTQLLQWDLPAAQAYADIRHTLTSSGQLIGELDMMIAAHALATGSILVSNNTRHFSRLVPPLHLENWTQP